MASHEATDLPNVAEILGPLLGRVEPERRPLLLALAERMAAERYRGWAEEVSDPAQRAELRSCADREEEIASRIEALTPDAAAVQRDIVAKLPDLDEINRSVFAGRPLADQFAIQADGERAGGATWQAFAAGTTDESARAAFLACADLEEMSARVLDGLLGRS